MAKRTPSKSMNAATKTKVGPIATLSNVKSLACKGGKCGK